MNDILIPKTMGSKPLITITMAALCALTAPQAYADGGIAHTGLQFGNIVRADGHAPIGVMGEHMHKKGEWMLSYRYMQMGMEGNRIGTNSASPTSIATTVPNRFFGAPGQPPTLRVVPTKMTMDMHMFGAMYAPNDNLTLMAMVNYLDKSMDHITFAGGAGTTVLGGFTTKASGFGDVKVSGLYRLYDDETHHVHMNLGFSLPTGAIDKTGKILAPNGMTPTPRLPYAMQLGTGTVDLLPGLTYTARADDWSWGAQYRAEMRLENTNSEGYSLGDKHAVTAWVARQWQPWISTSLRVDAITQDAIEGIDPNIVAPVQTADNANYGGQRIDVMFGVNLAGQKGMWRGHRLAMEIGMPIYQSTNGPQLETDYIFNLGWQKAF